MSVVQLCDIHAAKVGIGPEQKFRACMDANSARLVGKPVYAAWK
jgi:hypothetical protein